VYDGVQHILHCVFCFVCLRHVSCVWWCPTHMALCFLFCYGRYGHSLITKTGSDKRKQIADNLKFGLVCASLITKHKNLHRNREFEWHELLYVITYLSLSPSFVLCMMVSNTYCVVFFVLFVFVMCLVYDGVQHILHCVFCFVCLRHVSCVWWCPTHIALCQTKQKTQCNMCWTPSYTRHMTKTNKTKNTMPYVLDTIIHKTHDEDKQNKKHNAICVGHHHTHTYCVVFFVLFVFVMCLVYDGVQHILCSVAFGLFLSSSCVLCKVKARKKWNGRYGHSLITKTGSDKRKQIADNLKFGLVCASLVTKHKNLHRNREFEWHELLYAITYLIPRTLRVTHKSSNQFQNWY
jgi:flagellar biosynthesis protein FliP